MPLESHLLVQTTHTVDCCPTKCELLAAHDYNTHSRKAYTIYTFLVNLPMPFNSLQIKIKGELKLKDMTFLNIMIETVKVKVKLITCYKSTTN